MNTRIQQEDIAFVLQQPLPWKSWANKTVLITGANGFIASFLVRVLLAADVSVIALVRNKEKAIQQFADISDNSQLSFVVQDVCDLITIKEKVDVIIHAASQASPKYYHTDPVGTLKANVLGTYNMLEFARLQNVQNFLFFSSAEVYGQVDGFQPINEHSFAFLDPTDVRSCYAESKRMGETMAVSWGHQYQVPVKIIRLFHTYGPGMDLKDGRVFADFVSNIVHNQNIVMKSDGKARRAFCYLADAATGIFTVLLKGTNSEAYNIANDQGEVSIGELADLLVTLFPEKKLHVVREHRDASDSYAVNAIQRYLPDIIKVKTLGWKPHYSVAEGFKRTIQSYL